MRDKPTSEYQHAIEHHTPKPFEHLVVRGLPVDEARNQLVAQVLALDPRPTFVLSVYDDAFWVAGTIEAVLTDLASRGPHDLVAPLFGARMPGAPPEALTTNGELVHPSRLCRQQLVELSCVGLHFVCHRTDLLDLLPSRPFELIKDLDEDFSFCERVRQVGGHIWLNARLPPVFHVGDNGFAFLPFVQACRIENGCIRNVGASPKPDADRSYGRAVDARRAEVQQRMEADVKPTARSVSPNLATESEHPFRELNRRS